MSCICLENEDFASQSSGSKYAESEGNRARDYGGESLSGSTASTFNQPDVSSDTRTSDSKKRESEVVESEFSQRYTGDFVDFDYAWPIAKRMESTPAGAQFWNEVRRTVEIEFFRKATWEKLTHFSRKVKVKKVTWHESVDAEYKEKKEKTAMAITAETIPRRQSEQLYEDYDDEKEASVLCCSGNDLPDSDSDFEVPMMKRNVARNPSVHKAHSSAFTVMF